MVILAAAFTLAKCASFSYTAQDQWPGICVDGNIGHQSPINIDTRNVKGSKLAPFQFNSAFSKKIEGVFENTCQNVEVTPVESVSTIIQTPVWKYKLDQFHFHWGRKSCEGTEKIGGEDLTAGDALAVIAVHGEVSRKPIGGIFKKLDAAKITEVDTAIDVNDIIMSKLLPSNRDYYFYEGSLTTPDNVLGSTETN